MKRVLEPEVMDTWEDAAEYDSMDFTEVNQSFAERAVAIGPGEGVALDAGTGTARIPIIISRLRPAWRIIGIDLSKNMLLVGEKNIKAAKMEGRITLQQIDVKTLPYDDGYFDMVLSNTIIHHLPDPIPFFAEIRRVLKPSGALLLRDLIRPADERAVEALVTQIGPEYDEHQRKLFRDSLHASFTLDEVHSFIEESRLTGVKLYQSSDRHWTIEKEYH